MAIKICGMTSPEDAVLAANAGVDAIGMIFAKSSPVRISLETAEQIVQPLPAFVSRIGVFTDAKAEDLAGAWKSGILDGVQCYESIADEEIAAVGIPRDRVIRAIRVRDGKALDTAQQAADCGAIHLDAYSPEREGGTGKTFDWGIARSATDQGLRIVLAGGLTPDTVAEAIREAQPYAVDARSGVEREPGVKDPEKVAAFCRAAMSHA